MATALPYKTRFVDSGWRITIPKQMRDHLGWDKETTVCVSWDGRHIRIRHPLRCIACADVTKVGALGKIVIPPRVRAETHIYRGQVLRLSVEGEEVMISPEAEQVRCQACGSEMDVKETLAHVYLCRRCRESLERVAQRA